MALTIVNKLRKRLPVMDVADPESWMASAVQLFASYPVSVMERAEFLIPLRTNYPTLKNMREVLDEAYEPVARAIAAERARSETLALPPPRGPRSPEHQACVDAQVEDLRRRFGPPAPRRGWYPPMYRGDGRYAERVAAELASRRAKQGWID